MLVSHSIEHLFLNNQQEFCRACIDKEGKKVLYKNGNKEKNKTNLFLKQGL